MRPRLIGLVVAALAVVQPSSAYARNICVDQFPFAATPPAECTGGSNETVVDVQTGLSKAHTYAGFDSVIIEPGTHTASGGGFVYNSGMDLNNPVEIIGAGPSTRLARPSAGIVLEVQTATTSRIANLTLVPFSGNAGMSNRGIRASLATIDTVAVDPAGAPSNTTGFELGSGTLRNVTADLPKGAGLSNVGARTASQSIDTTVDGGTLSGTIGLDLAGPTTVSGTRITGGFTGVRTANDLTILNSQIRMAPSAPFQTGISVITSQNTNLFTHHLTMVGSNASQSAGIRTNVTGAAVASVFLRNSIVRDAAFTFDRQHSSGGLTSIEATHSDFSPTFTGASTGSYSADATNLDVEPAFVDPAAGDYRLAASSPVVDKGSPDAVFLEPTVDLAGNPRIVDGDGDGTARRDMGAFELQPAPPAGVGPGTTPPGGETPGGGTTPAGGDAGTGAAGSSTVTALRLAPKRFLAATRGAAVTNAGARKPGALVTFTVTQAATTAFSLERKTTGRRSRGKCVKATRRNRKAKKCVRWVAVKKSGFTRDATAGANSFRLTGRLGRKALAPGGYRLVARAGTSSKNASFTVMRPARKKR